MHELSIAMSIIEVAEEELAQQGGGRVEKIYIALGQLSGVIPQSLLSAYEVAAENSNLSKSSLVIEEMAVEIDCPTCGGVRQVESIQELRCRECGTLSGKIVSGREMEITAMEICDEAKIS